MKTALLAAYEKDDVLLRLATLLRESDWELHGSAGTAKFLGERGFPCRDVAEIIGPPILGHRVVTLARKIYGALLATTKEDYEEIDRLGVRPYSLVYVTLYPLEEAIRSGAPESEIIEKTDIGGPTLLRAAAKGRRLVISNPGQIDLIEAFLKAGSPESERDALITKLVAASERRVADYVGASAAYWESRVR